MSLQLLLELLDTTSSESADVKRSKSSINHIAQALFKQDAGPVKDLKRSKEAKYFGVANAKSVLTNAKGDGIRLTFDNSTDSGEFEINSLVSLGIEKGSDEDKAIKQLYKDLEISSKKRTGYVVSGDQTLLREIHLGKLITKDTAKMVRAIIKLLKKGDPEEKSEEKPEVKPKEKEKEKEKEKPKVRESIELREEGYVGVGSGMHLSYGKLDSMIAKSNDLNDFINLVKKQAGKTALDPETMSELRTYYKNAAAEAKRYRGNSREAETASGRLLRARARSPLQKTLAKKYKEGQDPLELLESLKSKTILFKALDEFFKTDKYSKEQLKAVGNETYGRKSMIYVGTKSQAERRELEKFLKDKGFTVSVKYDPEGKRAEVQVSYFKGSHWDE